MQLSPNSCHYQMKVMRVVLTQLTYQLHYGRSLTFNMSPAWNMHHSSQCLQNLAVHHKHLPVLCTDTYPLAQLTTPLQTTLQYVQAAQMKRKKIFRWYPWMMKTGLPKKYLKELFVYTNMDYHIIYANTHALIGAITLFHTWIVWDLSDISDYEDYMVASSDEEILGMEEVPY